MKIYSVTIFLQHGLSVPFKADEITLNRVLAQMARPGWLRSKTFGFIANDGAVVKVDFGSILAVNAKELGETDKDGDFIVKREPTA